MALVYKASNVAKAEQEFGLKFFDVFNQIGNQMPSMSEILFLLRAGGASDDETDVLLAKRGIDGVFIEILEAMKTSGFLGNLKLDTQKVQKDLEKVRREASQNSGESTNA